MNQDEQHIIDWQSAREVFEKSLHLNLAELTEQPVYQQLTTGAQEKVRQLFGNKLHELTLLDQPELLFLRSLKNADLSGSTLGSYELTELLAHGGMSSVYRARKKAVEAQKDVAIKLIPANLRTRQTIALFKSELDTLARLYHPNIIAMHHGDVDDCGTPYLVMELVEHCLPIDQYVQQHQLTPQQVISLFITLGQVLDYAHQNQIIHQDIKPSNVVVDQHGHLKVLDFGIAALTGAVPDHRAYTPGYAAPEQQRNQHSPTASSDIFALCSLLLHCLTGHNDQQRDWQQSALQSDLLDGDLKMIIAKGLKQNESHRYRTVSALVLDLNLWQKKLPIRTFSNSLFYRGKKFLQRQPLTFALGLLTMVSMVTGLLFYQHQYEIAALETANARQIKQVLLDAIKQTDPEISLGEDLTVKDMLHQVEIHNLQNQLTDPNIRQELLLTLAQAFYQLGAYESASNNLNQALANQPDDREGLLLMAELGLAQNDAVMAQQYLQRFINVNDEANTPQLLKGALIKAGILVADANFSAAEQQFSLARELTTINDDIQAQVDVLAAHAESLLEQDEAEQAITLIGQAIQLSEEHTGPEHPLTLNLRAQLAEMFLSSSGNRVKQAVTMFEAIIPAQQALMGEYHPRVTKSQFLLSTAFRALNQLDQAAEYANQALTGAQRTFGDQHVFTAKVMMSLGGTLLAQGKLNAAIQHASKAVGIYNKQLGETHHETLQYKTSLVAMLVKNQQHQQALDELLQILPAQQAKLGPQHRATLYVEVILTKTHTALQQLDKGIAVGERCLRNAQSDTSRNIMEVYCALALEDAYYQQGQYREALKLIETYQNDPLITSQPLALEQFTSHKKYIKEISPPVN